MYRRILVGFDGSPESLEALRRAVELAKTTGASLHIVTVVPPPSTILGPLMAPESLDFTPLVKAAEEALSKISSEAAAEGVEVSKEVRMGDPASSLIEAAADVSADLIVLGRRRLSGLERIALGSVSSKIVNHAPVDVLVVRPRESGGEA